MIQNNVTTVNEYGTDWEITLCQKMKAAKKVLDELVHGVINTPIVLKLLRR